MADKILKSFEVWIAAQGVKSRTRLRSVDNISLEGIARLRRLILQLAIQGKLIRQSLEDQASVSLIYRKEKSLPPIRKDEESFTLPSGWRFVRWGEIASWAIGSGFPKTIQGSQNLELLFCKVSDMNLDGNVRYILNTENTISLDTAREHRIKTHPAGTVIFPKIGGAIATNKRRIISRPTAIDNNCLGLVPSPAITSDYLFLVLSAVDLSEFQTGTSVPALSQSTLELLVVGLPPLAEQHRIVAKVEELMALCDELEKQETHHLKSHALLVETLLGTLTQAKDAKEFQQAWSLLAQHFDDLFTTEDSIDQLKQTILQLAVMGKLVPQDPNDEPASLLLERIATDKLKDGIGNKEKQLPKITEDDLPFNLPESWEWVRLGNIINVKSSKRIFVSDYVEIGVPFYRSKEIGELGRGESVTSELFISNEKYDFLKRNFGVPKAGDILIACIGGSIGNTWLVDDSKFYYKDGNLVQLDSIPQVSSYYLLNYLNSKFFYQTALGIVSGSAYDALTIEKIKKSLFPLPPLKEQQRIVSKVNELFALCDELKARLAAAQTLANQMAEGVVE